MLLRLVTRRSEPTMSCIGLRFYLNYFKKIRGITFAKYLMRNNKKLTFMAPTIWIGKYLYALGFFVKSKCWLFERPG